jgi:hypothetical protein
MCAWNSVAEANSEIQLRALYCSFETLLLNTLEKFWTQEGVSSPRNKFTAKEMSAKQVFRTTHGRDATCRYVLQIL